MSETSPVRTGMVALFCVFIATTQVLLLAQSGGRATASPERHGDSTADTAEVRALLREIRDTLHAGRPSPEQGRVDEPETHASRMDASEVPFDANLMERLETALAGFSTQVERLSGQQGPTAGVREEFTAWSKKPPVLLNERYASGEEARNDLLYRSYREVLKLLGPPFYFQASESGVREWIYKGGRLQFVDGFVTFVQRDGG